MQMEWSERVRDEIRWALTVVCLLIRLLGSLDRP